jgi:hypothetical protein
VDTPPVLVETVARPLAAGFGRLAGRRGGEAVHRRGLLADGRLEMRPGATPTGAVLLDRDRSYPVRVRLSWGVGPLRGLPDVAGLALRVADADGAGGVQDLLVDSSRPPPRDRVLVLRRDLAGWYGTPLRLRTAGPDGRLVHVAARVAVDGTNDGTDRRLTLDGARTAAAAGRLRVLLLVHDGRRLLAAGDIRLTEVAAPADPPRPRFDLGNGAGGLLSGGFWHALRQRTYAASRRGDPRAG